jgi:hypothetical protein
VPSSCSALQSLKLQDERECRSEASIMSKSGSGSV